MWATAVRGQSVIFLYVLSDTDGEAITAATLPVRVAHEAAVGTTTALDTGTASEWDAANMPGLYYYEYTVAVDEAYGNIVGYATAPAGTSVKPLVSGYNVSERLAYLDAIKTQTDQFVFVSGDVKSTLDGETVTVGDKTDFAISAVSRDDLVDKVWDEPVGLMSHNTAGTAGNRLNYMYDTIAGWATLGIQVLASSISSIADQVWRELLPEHTGVTNSVAQFVNDIWNYIAAYIRPQTDKLQFGAENDLKVTLDGETVTVGTNNDKTGYSLATAPPTAAEIQTLMESAGSLLDQIKDIVDRLPLLPANQETIDSQFAAIEAHGDAEWSTGTPTTPEEIRDEILEATASGFASGTIGDKISKIGTKDVASRRDVVNNS